AKLGVARFLYGFAELVKPPLASFPKKEFQSGSVPATLASRRKSPVKGQVLVLPLRYDTAKGKQSSSQVKKKVTPVLYAYRA
ncbi:hypothetical protein Ancab_039469, partial [Ancistrocladus abbreviatus]